MTIIYAKSGPKSAMSTFYFFIKSMDIYIDEAGRGPLAGPVYVGLILSFDQGYPYKDSKTVAEKGRILAYQHTQKTAQRSRGRASAAYIDKHGIVKAIRHAIYQGLWRLLIKKPLPYSHRALKQCIQEKAVHLHIDGNIDFGIQKHVNIPVTTYIRGDQRIAAISAASIIAKVRRDTYMIQQHKKYPAYNFHTHKGYGTAIHRDRIKSVGLTDLHRKSFCSRRLRG